jgi:hypothetical protein
VNAPALRDDGFRFEEKAGEKEEDDEKVKEMKK